MSAPTAPAARASYGSGPAALGELTHGSLRRIWLDDVALLVAGGASREEIAVRLGVKSKSLYRVLHRKGRLDLWHRASGRCAA